MYYVVIQQLFFNVLEHYFENPQIAPSEKKVKERFY